MAITYTVYLLATLAVTVWVGRSLFTGGRVFLVDIFGGNESLADAINRMLLVGFYLVNAGFVTLALKTASRPGSAAESIELLGTKIGLVLLVLGGMHLFNLVAFTRLRLWIVSRPIEIVEFIE